ncbi:1-aminocyclopropane-1-carboxylate deaminase/D-cysteine desulfhydrase [Dysosmobacter sp.]|uniref:1-aminocyclopropane-1-carboxylate deaminase/D-cysteine desulfhydrase n=1 Tax=Dysosmobacter sp. TaxID=2591382 RepID=UPI002A94FE5D|nr:D-cysteine desulfhydrase family protein [Dysosmobacter sp.]MCI6053821.1 D-cysteine desulfhydrase family protein [Dysosmobacter sp.]MDY5510797.1 D-cysteine desulfhydrase family protein [Dysosmobacter sp.]
MRNIASVPRVSLGLFPTPFYKLEAISARYGRNIWIKRDDLCGVALGGNKVRKLEFLLAQARADGCDTVFTTGGAQSNHAMLTAACAARLGMDCKLFLKDRGVTGRRGNLVLDEIYGAPVRLVDTDDYQDIYREMEAEAAGLEARGHRCCRIPLGGSTPLGTLGYAAAARECAVQAMAAGIRVGHLVSATGSGGTTAGLLLGAGLFLPGAQVTGMAVDPQPFRETVLDLAAGAAALLEAPFQPGEKDLHILDCAGPGYAVPDPAATPAILELARTEGILLDPVYTGKAWAGLLAQVKAGGFEGEGDIVFFHTGGAAALFAMDLPEATN